MNEKKEEIKKLKKEIEKIDESKGNAVNAWAKDIKAIADDPNFDVYSKKGKKRIEKATQVYAPLFYDLEQKREELVNKHNDLIDEINNEKSDKNN